LALAVAVVVLTPSTVTLAVMAAARALMEQPRLIRAGARCYLRAMPVAIQRAVAGDLPVAAVALERWAVTLPESPPARAAQEKTLPTTTILRPLTVVAVVAVRGTPAAGLRRLVAPAVAERDRIAGQDRRGLQTLARVVAEAALMVVMVVPVSLWYE